VFFVCLCLCDFQLFILSTLNWFGWWGSCTCLLCVLAGVFFAAVVAWCAWLLSSPSFVLAGVFLPLLLLGVLGSCPCLLCAGLAGCCFVLAGVFFATVVAWCAVLAFFVLVWLVVCFLPLLLASALAFFVLVWLVLSSWCKGTRDYNCINSCKSLKEGSLQRLEP